MQRLAERNLYKIMVLPTALVNIDGIFSGYLMSKVSNAMHIDSIRDYAKLLEVYGKLFKDVEYLHSKNIVIGDVKPANILIDYKYNSKFGDVDSMGIDELPIDHAEYRSHKAKMLPNYPDKFDKNSRQNMDNYLLLACFLNSLSSENIPLIGKLFNSKLSIEHKKLLFELLKNDIWSTPKSIGNILEEERKNLK